MRKCEKEGFIHSGIILGIAFTGAVTTVLSHEYIKSQLHNPQEATPIDATRSEYSLDELVSRAIYQRLKALSQEPE